jgi:hypothetical protein
MNVASECIAWVSETVHETYILSPNPARLIGYGWGRAVHHTLHVKAIGVVFDTKHIEHVLTDAHQITHFCRGVIT